MKTGLFDEQKYEKELREICKNIKVNSQSKSEIISIIKTNYYLKKLITLNRKTNNKHIDEICKAIGKTKMSYKKFCRKNNYYTHPSIINSFNKYYIKMSKKSLKIKTKRSNVINNPNNIEIEYNSDKGSYTISYFNNGKKVEQRNYKAKNIKYLDTKRLRVIKELKSKNFGVDVLEELNIEKSEFKKINPDIIHILLKEGQLDYAKMYIKSVAKGERICKLIKIRYVLNRNLKKGVFSVQENRDMKKMAKMNCMASELIIFNNKKRKVIHEPNYFFMKKVKNLMFGKSGKKRTKNRRILSCIFIFYSK